jgi:predicted RND superfamily exporter protein
VGTASMGQILTIGVLLNLVATLIVLPALLKDNKLKL